MKKIIHLSDIHIGHEDCALKFRTIADNICFLKQPACNYVIVITGDIVNNANHPEFTDEAVKILEQLEEEGYTVLVVPGNHDYGNGVEGKKEFVSRFKEKFFRTTDITYPKLDIIGKIAFIGLDSNAEELNWHDRFFSEGELGTVQLKRLKKVLSNPEIKSKKKVIYLHHHPFDFKLGMQLKDRKELKKIIENKVDAILFGHYHTDPASAGKVFNGIWGIARCYNAGSSTHKNGNPGFHRVIDLSKKDPRSDYDGCFI